MRQIDKYFYGTAANRQVSLEIERGEIHALLGENGAGKTTLMNILYGIYQKDGGSISWKGEEVSFSSPKDAIANHIGMVHQHFMLVETMTVSQNITLGLRSKRHPFPDRAAIDARITELSGRYGLQVNPRALISELSVGEQQRVEIIKLLYRDAELLILDEPTAVLTPLEIEQFFQVLRALRDQGHSVILITHKIPEVMSITDTITVLRDGQSIRTLRTAEADEQLLSQLMIGRPLQPVIPEVLETEGSRTALAIDRLSLTDRGIRRLDHISFEIRTGEIFGLAGVDGNGQKELAETILGIRIPQEGSISFFDTQVQQLNVQQRKRLGLAYISDDRHHDGLIMDMSLTENYLLKAFMDKRYSRYGFVDYRACRAATTEAVTSYRIKTRGTEEPVRLLSGGNQQKLILSRELSGAPGIIIAFQPTRGLDIGASEYIQKMLAQKRREGCAILLISADLDEIQAMSDRIGIIYKGALQDIISNTGNLDTTRIGLLMAGHRQTEES